MSPQLTALPSFSQLAILDQMNEDISFRRVNYLYLATHTCPIVFLYPVEIRVAVNGVQKCSLKPAKLYTWSNFINTGLPHSQQFTPHSICCHMIMIFFFPQQSRHHQLHSVQTQVPGSCIVFLFTSCWNIYIMKYIFFITVLVWGKITRSILY